MLNHGFFLNGKLGKLPPANRLLFSALWTLADKAGRLDDDPDTIRVWAMPFDEGDCDEMLNNLAQLGFILRYEVDGNRFIQVQNWDKYQTPHWNETASQIPEPQEDTLIDPCKTLDSPLQVSSIKSKSKIKSKREIKILGHREAVNYFCETYKSKLDMPYKFNGSVDGERVRRLLKAYGLDRLKPIIDQLFVTEDEWIKKQAEVSIAILELKANKLAQEVSKKRQMKIYDLQERLGRKPTDEEVAELFGEAPK